VNLRNLVYTATLYLLVSNICWAESSIQALKEDLGRKLYFDKNLSLNRTQSCASCHDPETGFVDATNNSSKKAASLGDNGKSLGDRNAPTAAYANQIPAFHRNNKGKYIGGQFWDGRASSLKDQAAGPPLNKDEMAMPDEQAVAKRIQSNTDYLAAFKAIYGQNIFDQPKDTYLAMTDAIAAFEQTDFFSPFDSKYDRHLRGEYQLNEQEELGMTLFFSQQFTNCNQCHLLNKRPMTSNETFSNYSYHNTGIPTNKTLRKLNGLGESHIDEGLLNHPKVNDDSVRGQFKTPTLRNIAITSPYMHNGVFEDLRTVVLFYNKYNSKSAKRQTNPETKKAWAKPEISENLSLKELESGPALDDRRIDALVSFMKLLTDQRYEHLIK
jgi:cytochrome c peroxidase